MTDNISNLRHITDDEHEAQKAKMPLEAEVRESLTYVSNEYLSAAASMVAWQFIDNPEEPEDLIQFGALAADLMRNHCPMAYSYLFQNNSQDWPLPSGALDIILQHVRREKPLFMGGKNGDHNFFD